MPLLQLSIATQKRSLNLLIDSVDVSGLAATVGFEEAARVGEGVVLDCVPVGGVAHATALELHDKKTRNLYVFMVNPKYYIKTATSYFLLHEVPRIFGASTLAVLIQTRAHALRDIIRQTVAVHQQNDGNTQLQDEEEAHADDVLQM